MIFKNSTVYDVLKKLALIVLPAISALYFSLAQIWGFPYAEQIVGTIACIETFLGAILGVSNAKYNKLGCNEEEEHVLAEDGQ